MSRAGALFGAGIVAIMGGRTIDLSLLPLKAGASSTRPKTLCDPAFVNALPPFVDVVALQTAPRALREQWQARQIANLLGHAATRSAFFRKRIGGRSPRADLKGQVESEGALLGSADKLRVQRHSTSGSSGIPVGSLSPRRPHAKTRSAASPSISPRARISL